MTRDKLAQLGQILTNTTNTFQGHTDGRWYETGHSAYMTAEFTNVNQATMFAQKVIWDNQVKAEVIGGDWDDPTQGAHVMIKLA